MAGVWLVVNGRAGWMKELVQKFRGPKMQQPGFLGPCVCGAVHPLPRSLRLSVVTTRGKARLGEIEHRAVCRGLPRQSGFAEQLGSGALLISQAP